MKSRAAVLFETGQKLEICEVDVQDPEPGEVRILHVDFANLQLLAGFKQDRCP